MLLDPDVVVTGGDSVESGFVAQLYSGALAVVSVVGRPPGAAIAEAVAQATDLTPVFAHPENARHVAEALASCAPSEGGRPWAPERVLFHRLPGLAAPHVDDGRVRLLRADDPLDHLPSGLRYEIAHARERSPIAVAMDGATAVSFCYACWITDLLWDLSIDTLEAFRRRGLAGRAARFLIAQMSDTGRNPVWAALESNAASLALGRKLGFVPAGENVVFSRGAWAYYTRGYQP
jgi:hypothetical protein